MVGIVVNVQLESVRGELHAPVVRSSEVHALIDSHVVVDVDRRPWHVLHAIFE